MDIYCIDTSSLIEMKDKYPQDVTLFKKLWNNMDELCRKNRLIAPIEVLKEIEQGDDELKRWAKAKEKKIFVKPDKKQSEKMKEILAKYSFLANPEKPGPNADPWLIAIAIVKNEEEKKSPSLFGDKKYIVATEESKTRKNKMPFVCKIYNIECINLIELFRKEKW